MEAALLRVLRTDNPWLDDPGRFPSAADHRVPINWLPRIVPSAGAWPVARHAHLIIGARQVGKSSYLWRRFVQDGVPPLFVNAEEPLVRRWCESAAHFRSDLSQLAPAGTPIFFEEAQHLLEAGIFFKGLIDSGIPHPVYVTGSSSFHLIARTRESLAGRAVRVEMHPLSLAELAAALPPIAPAIRAARVRELALRATCVGGYPAAWTAQDPGTILNRLVGAFVLRDASDLYGVSNLAAFRTLLGLLARQSGDLVNVSEWAGLVGVSRPTVDAWIDALVESQLVVRVPPFSGGKRAELTRRPKIYFRDPGLRNALLGDIGVFEHSLERGKLLETWVAAELRKHADPLLPHGVVRYWRSKAGAEVDFVLQARQGLVGVEVKSGARAARLSRSLRSFASAYRPCRIIVIHTGDPELTSLDGIPVHVVGPEALSDPALFFG